MRYLIRWFFAAFICICSVESKAQILEDSAAIKIITDGMFNIYNLEFDKAETALKDLTVSYPGHPVLSLFNGMKIYWENFPLIPTSSERIIFESEMRKCIDLSEKVDLPDPSYEADYLLANICARGLLLLFYADNDISGEVTQLVTRTYKPLMRSFDFTSSCTDFYYFTGVYNYYREAYPKVYPIYKTVVFIFPPGDMRLGLQQLEICGRTSVALRAEAISILSWIKMNFETDFQAALPYSKLLTDQYPSNPLYKVYYIKNLLLLKRYDKAEEVIKNSGKEENNAFYLAVRDIFNGIIQEKKYRNNELAQEFYLKGIDKVSVFGAYGNEYAAYGYFGLSRIGEESADKHERKMNHRKAMDIVDFKNITFDE